MEFTFAGSFVWDLGAEFGFPWAGIGLEWLKGYSKVSFSIGKLGWRSGKMGVWLSGGIILFGFWVPFFPMVLSHPRNFLSQVFPFPSWSFF